ncbi:BTAD domain-containing putative transcriptional regulator [Actinomadura sp. WMMB 499]|uniref:ATP-binding protein n=1 Tax=Actinomadura sp. WMMB 499 TaxID=1219491 RepID=UPI0012486A47|nr:BTAD domain-containing putative transcriptional regulator [Actinomadura sp. WMMB 499]QFG23476.1 AfsR/SARP family transcriptional regulator [Actinomadura sp. WMMB 499]
MRFGVLGPLEIRTDGDRPVRVPEVKVRLLLSALLAAGGRPVPSDRLIRDLWDEDRPARPAAALRAKVSQLRRALEDAEPGGRALVAARAPGYALASEAVDALRFEALASRTEPASAARASVLTEALALWRGPAFADFADAPFAVAAAARLEERRLTAREELAEARLALGEHRAIAADLTDLAALHPLRERLQAALMRALYGSGRQHEALQCFDRVRNRLRDELGLDPGPDLAALHQAILRQDPSLDAPARAPLAPLAPARPPAPRTELIGRDTEPDAVAAALREARLVTLTGPGGVGKTRLALEVAARAAAPGSPGVPGVPGAPDFPDGIVFAELAGVAPDRVAEAVTAAAGLREPDGPDAPDAPDGTGAPDGPVAAAGRLAGRRALLVLDNCEHAIDPVAAFADALLTAGAELRILATAREPLGISGERLHPVTPLEIPEAPPEHDLAALARVPSVRLFVARAAAADPGFALDGANAAAVAAVCRRLDGLPLALELAAARVRALGPETLAARLDDRFRVLRSDRRDVPPRQRTLLAAIEWSWEPLGPAERAVLRRLAVHAGGCTLEGAEEVCAGGEVEQAEVMDVIVRLVDRSLVMAADGPGGVRYRLLESVAAFALDRLADAGERDDVQARHDDYYARVAECADAYRAGHARVRWLARLDAEAANLRRALESAVGRRDAHLALRLTASLAWYWIERGRAAHAGRSLGAALADAAAVHHLDGLASARILGDAPAIASALDGLAGARLLAGRADQAARLLGAAATAREAAGPPAPPGVLHVTVPSRETARLLAAARTALGDAFPAAYDAGRAHPPAEAAAGR